MHDHVTGSIPVGSCNVIIDPVGFTNKCITKGSSRPWDFGIKLENQEAELVEFGCACFQLAY